MSENTTISVETNGSEKKGRKVVPSTVFATYEEAAAAPPQTEQAEKWKVFRVTKPNGDEVYAWGFTGIVAVNTVARADGYQVEAATRKARTSTVILEKDKFFEKLAVKSDVELGSLGWSKEEIMWLRGRFLQPKDSSKATTFNATDPKKPTKKSK